MKMAIKYVHKLESSSDGSTVEHVIKKVFVEPIIYSDCWGDSATGIAYKKEDLFDSFDECAEFVISENKKYLKQTKIELKTREEAQEKLIEKYKLSKHKSLYVYRGDRVGCFRVVNYRCDIRMYVLCDEFDNGFICSQNEVFDTKEECIKNQISILTNDRRGYSSLISDVDKKIKQLEYDM